MSKKVVFRDATIKYVNTFVGADLCGANLSGTIFTDADLRGAMLMNTNLTGANLSNVDLHGAWLDGANLTGVKLKNSCISMNDHFSNVTIDSELAAMIIRTALLAISNCKDPQILRLLEDEELAAYVGLDGK